MPIEIYKIEEFELPDKNKTIIQIIPLGTEDMDLILEFMDLAKKVDLQELKESKKRAKKADPSELKEVTGSLRMAFEDLTPIADKIIDRGTRLKDRFNTIPLFEEKENVEYDGITYDKIKIPLMEIIDGKPVQQMGEVPIPFPKEYRTLANRIELTKKIVEISMGDVSEVVDSPLLQKPVTKQKE